MNGRNHNKFFIFLASAVFFILALVESTADEQQAPVIDRIEADGRIVNLFWHFPGQIYSLEGFNLYMAIGETNTLEDFELNRFIPADSVNKARDTLTFSFALELEPGKYSFYMTSVKRQKESEPSAILTITVASSQYIVFQSEPRLEAFVGDRYQYQVSARSYDNSEINYMLAAGPENSEIDREKGIFLWNPKEKGLYSIRVRAYFAEDTSIYRDQKWTVRVFKCRNFSTLEINIFDEDDNPVQFGIIYLFVQSNSNDSIYKYGETGFQNGKAVIGNLDQGSYRVKAEGADFESEFFADAYNLADATPIFINCGSDKKITMNVKSKITPREFSVSGRVTSGKDGSPIEFARVLFFGWSNSGRQRSFSYFSDAEGYYSAALTNEYEYIAVAYPVSDTNGSNSSDLLPVYYDNASDRAEATVIRLDSNRDDINFVLPQRLTFSNSIVGRVINSRNTPLPGVNITAYMVNDKFGNRENLFNGRTVETKQNGNFNIANLKPGDYILFASSNSGAYVPGYYKEQSSPADAWKEATVVKLDEYEKAGFFDFRMEELSATYGAGLIRGRVTTDDAGIISVDDIPLEMVPVQGVFIWVYDSGERVRGFAITDQSGVYEIGSLDPGDYRAYLDKVGYKRVSFNFTINAQDGIQTRDLSISKGDPSGLIQGCSEIYAPYHVFPLPADEFIIISLPDDGIKYKINITDATGKRIRSFECNGGRHRTSTFGMGSGLYFINISNRSDIRTVPFLISR